MHELVAIRAVAEHERVGAVGDPVEQQGEDPEASVPDDRPRPHDRDVEPVGGRPQTGPLGGELGRPVRLDGVGHRVAAHGVRLGDAEHRARREVDNLAHLRDPARLQQRCRAVHVDGSQSGPVTAQRHLGDAVVHDVDTGGGPPHGGGVADVGDDHLDAIRLPGRGVDVENADGARRLDEVVDEQAPEVAIATGDENLHSAIPSARHHSTLRRMPSARPTDGSYPSSRWAAEMSQAIVSPSSPRTWSWLT